MGILDAVFTGQSGLVASLHEMLGGTATIKRASFQRNLDEGTIETIYERFDVPFVANSGAGSGADLNAPDKSRTDFKEPLDVLQGSIPASALDEIVIQPEKDVIEYQGIDYLITNVDSLRVGNIDAMYTISATKCENNGGGREGDSNG